MRMQRPAWLLIAALLVGCSVAPGPPSYTLTNYNAIPGWQEDNQADALTAFQRSCKKMASLPPEKTVGQGPLAAPAAIWHEVCSAAEHTAPTHARHFFETYFTPFNVAAGHTQTGLFTGYYEPMLRGSRTSHSAYRYPVYGLPPDLAPGKAYFTREEIERGALEQKGLEIAWTDDPVALFFLHIQGSGRMKLDNGKVIRLAYAGKNGQPYVALGKVLVDAGQMKKEDVNLFSLKNWLREHPECVQAALWKNPSYVFFKEEPVKDEPAGAQGVPLTATRSLAVDPRFWPYGIPLYLQSAVPPTRFHSSYALGRLMVAQDTGGAIRGVVRGDVYFGSGSQAEAEAGHMKAPGTLVALLPHAIAAQLR